MFMQLVTRVSRYFDRMFINVDKVTDSLYAAINAHSHSVEMCQDPAAKNAHRKNGRKPQMQFMHARYMLVALAWLGCKRDREERLPLTTICDWLSLNGDSRAKLMALLRDATYTVNGTVYVDVTSPALNAARRTSMCLGMSARRQGKRIRTQHMEVRGMIGTPSNGASDQRPTWDWDMPSMARRTADDFSNILSTVSWSCARILCRYLAWQLTEHPDRAPVIGIPLVYKCQRTGDTVIAALPLNAANTHSVLTSSLTYYYWKYLHIASNTAAIFNESVKDLGEVEHFEDVVHFPMLSLKSRAVYSETKRRTKTKKSI